MDLYGIRSGATHTAAATTTQTSLTLADIQRVQRMLDDFPPEPIGEWMRQRGAPPEVWVLVLPEAMREQLDGPALWPEYVAFSALLTTPVFLPRAVFASGRL